MTHQPTTLYGAAPKERLSLYRTCETAGASLIGGFFLILADIIYNEDKAVTTQISGLVGRHISPNLDNTTTELVAFLVILALGLGLCFVFQPKTRIKAFGTGSSVIAVLVGMNIGANAINTASGADLRLSGTVQIALEEPRAFGPLGVGTAITGKSAANIIDLPLTGYVTVPCSGDLSVGDDSYCRVTAEAASKAFAGLLSTNDPVWIKR